MGSVWVGRWHVMLEVFCAGVVCGYIDGGWWCVVVLVMCVGDM